MLVSMVMLTASVFPHHHHRELLCLQHDVTECDCECPTHPHQHSTSDDNRTCHTGCVTHFHSLTPERAQDNVSSHYSFCQLLYTMTDVLILSFQLIKHKHLPYNIYVEKLHSASLARVMGLRAPPVRSCLEENCNCVARFL